MDPVCEVFAFVGTGSDGLDYVGRLEVESRPAGCEPVWLQGHLLDGRRLHPLEAGRVLVEGSELIIQPTRLAPCG
ncbi:hypothetical protein QFW77_18955 [Luteimonas sp. RD2P54]|uniref:Uncharacterized protein n=1 Tax=Luteimonas endophytica TaxID=3042023 RepID=A0ABT6JEQ9_9GAMM|nr:hypothetical protein [Luteimonas endophytica]MDH5825050.1 hypothetical protein [Luteimonas endophytica]